MPVVAVKCIDFAAMHRIPGHTGGCGNLHGHNYRAEIAVTAPELDRLGMVVDFADLKKLVGGWIKEYWDHNCILQDTDPLYAHWHRGEPDEVGHIFNHKIPFTLPQPPTAEVMALHLLDVTTNLLTRGVNRPRPDGGLKVEYVKLWETPDSFALALPDKAAEVERQIDRLLAEMKEQLADTLKNNPTLLELDANLANIERLLELDANLANIERLLGGEK